MILQHNISALNAHRNNGINNAQTSSNLEKLSSGYRINRAADDAAGLAISEKMRSQIRGLGMAEQNTSNAVDLIQTAEGGLNEMHAILHRMRELAVQAANGTYVDEDRAQINLELNALKSEVNRIASSTHFNGINLLDGTLGGSTGATLPGNVANNGSLGQNGYYAGTYPAMAEFLQQLGFASHTVQGVAPDGAHARGHVGFSSIDASLVGETATLIVTSGSATGGDARLALQVGDSIYHSIVSDGSGTAPNTADQNQYVFVDADGNTMAVLSNTANTNAAPYFALSQTAQSGVISGLTLTDPLTLCTTVSSAGATMLPNSLQNVVFANGSSQLIFQIGANGGADQQVGTSVPLMNCANLGNYIATSTNPTGTLAGISVLTREMANEAIEVIDAAVQQVSSTRASLGSLQNRLEHTLNNLGVTKENLTAAESTIRDVDMAKEMMEFTKNSILVQASQAMLAQANQLPQGVLSLLS